MIKILILCFNHKELQIDLFKKLFKRDDESSRVLINQAGNLRNLWTAAVLESKIDTLMSIYSYNAIMKPIFSNVIRSSPEDIKAFYEGSQKYGDVGLLNMDLTDIKYIGNKSVYYGGAIAEIGKVKFMRKSRPNFIADYTMVLNRPSAEKTKIICGSLELC